MSDPLTPNYEFTLPTVGGDADTWGGLNNANWSSVDGILGNFAGVIDIAGNTIIEIEANLTTTVGNLANLTTTVSGLSVTVGNQTTELGTLTTGLATTNANLATVTSAQSATAASLATAESSLSAVETQIGNATQGTSANSIGYLGVPTNPQSGAYTLEPTDAGKKIYSSNSGSQTITIATHAVQAIAVDSVILVVNDGAGSITIAPSGVTLILAGSGTTGSRTLGVKGMATLIQVATDRWFISGSGLT